MATPLPPVNTESSRTSDRPNGPKVNVQEPGSSDGRDEPRVGNSEGLAEVPPKSPKVSILTRLGLDVPTLSMMFKGAIAPTIAVSIYQADPVAGQFQTIGYLVGIISILSIPIMPRGKFIQNLILNIIFLCFGAALAVLILWSSLQARLHTQGASAIGNPASPAYNSSQAAVSAVWLFVSTWFVNHLRAKYTSLNLPVILTSIILSISCTFSVYITTEAALEAFIARLLEAMLSGLAIGTGCSLFIFPFSSRAVTLGQMNGCLTLLRGAMKQEQLYLQSLERDDMFACPADIGAAVDGQEQVKWSLKGEKKPSQISPNNAAEAKALRETIAKIRQLVGVMQTNLPFAKRDISFGKHDADDVKEIFRLLRSCLIPTIGLSTIIDIFQRLAEHRGWYTNDDTPADVLAEKNEEKRVWNEIMRQLHEPFGDLATLLDQGLEHAGILLEILPKPKKAKSSGAGGEDHTNDVEAKGDSVEPGDTGFAKTLEERMTRITKTKEQILRVWAKERGLMMPLSSGDDENLDKVAFPTDDSEHRRDRTQLFILLYIEKLMIETGRTIQCLVEYADEAIESGRMKRRRVILPSFRVLKKWAASVFANEDSSGSNNADLLGTGTHIVYDGDGYAAKKNPEHLPPSNNWERAGNLLRGISRFFGSSHSAFGFRAACATFTVGVVAFLEPSYVFFQEQRLVWAMIIIAIGMTETSGQSVFGFVLRIVGTFMAMVLSIVNWYIVDGHPPGVLVFLFVFLFIEYYFFIKYPALIPACMIMLVTHTLIVGYELQVVKIGVQAAEAMGQPAYAIYLLAPYRLATVAGGCAVAFFWTIFPYPLTDRTWLRRDLSTTMYLLARYFSVIIETLKSRLEGTAGAIDVKNTPAYHLDKHRNALFGKLMLLLPALRQHANFQRWEPTIGGKFPREIYEDVIARATRITSYLTLIAHTVSPGWDKANGRNATMTESDSEPSTSNEDHKLWIETLAEVLDDITPTQHTIVCTLTLVSNALESGRSLPPHMPLPRPYELTQQLETLTAKSGDKRAATLLDAKNMTENGYAEFAVLQVCSTLVCDDLDGLAKSVARLVGVVDYSFRVETSSGNLSSDASSSYSWAKPAADGKGKGKSD